MKHTPGHFKDVCSCGAVIAQCRCCDPDKKANIIQDGCSACRAKFPGTTYPPPIRRTLTNHIVQGDSANQLQITVLDSPGAGGANHEYRIAGTYAKGEVVPPARHLEGEVFQINRDGSVTLTLGKICFQDGPIQEAGVNGVTHEALLAIIIDRLRSFQAGPFPSLRNEAALEKCAGALDDLQMRTRDRIARGVEGKNKQ